MNIDAGAVGTAGRRLCVLVGLALIIGRAGADAEPVLSEHDFFMELPVVLTATRLQQPVAEAPAAVTLIDRELIEASGARELVDILRLVPGMLVARHSAYEPIVTHGGLGERFSRRMQVLVDGRSVYQPFSGGVLWTDLGLAIDDIQHIEVIRGPNAAAYGPNSFLAIINIITRHPAETAGHYVSARAGNNGIRDLTARQSGSSEHLDYRLTLATRRDDGFPDFVNDKRAHFGDLRVDYRLTTRHTFSTRAGLGTSRKGRGFVGDDLDPARHFTTDSAHLQLRLDQDDGAGESWSMQYYYQQSRSIDEFDVQFMGHTFSIDENIRGSRHDLEFERRQQIGPDTRLVWGGSLRNDRVASPTFFSDRSTVSDDLYRVFGNLEQRLGERAIVNLGAMYEHSDLFGGQFSPRAALNVLAHPGHTLRLIASRATRTPVLTEELARRIYVVDVGLPDPVEVPVLVSEGGLEPETIDYYELGHHGMFADGRLTLDTRLFSSRIRHLIDGDGPNSISFSNYPGSSYQGIEMQMGYRLTPRTRLHGGITHHFNRRDRSDRLRDLYGTAIPRYILNAAVITQVSDRLRLSGNYYYYSEVNWLDGDPTDAHDGFLDLSARWTFNRRARLDLTVQDVLARGYDARAPRAVQIYQENRRETRAFATLSFDFE